MKVIFLKDVAKVARKYDVKDVADGFALNNLIPRKIAVAATPAAVARIEAQLAADKGARAKIEEQVAMLKNATASAPVVISVRANAQGHLFESVSAAQIATSIQKAHGVALKAQEIELTHPLKEVGVHMVALKVGSVRGECTVSIEAQ